ncbi:MAG: zinc-binding dehydrogenase [Pseudomonadota bacterium]|jgi:NADPH2:quinone reductase
MMKAIQFRAFGGPEQLSLVDIDAPRPQPGQIAIDVHAAGVNFAEIMHRKGTLGGDPIAVPGLEVAGVVTELGANVGKFALGEQVAAFSWSPGRSLNGYAERVVVDARLAISLRRAERVLSFEEGAGFPCAAVTAYQLLADVARIRRGDTVLIHAAAGGVGTLAAQYAKALGAAKVIGVVGSDAKREAALNAGYDAVLLHKEFDKAIGDQTNGEGVDIVLESLGGETLIRSLGVLKPMGRVAYFGNASASEAAKLSAFDLWFGAKGVLGYTISGLAAAHPDRWYQAAEAAIRLVESGAVHLQPSRVLPLSEARQAHELIEARQATGKLILSVSR